MNSTDSPKKTIVLVSGKARSGKDTFSKFLKKHDKRIKIVAFAQNLKELAVRTFGISLGDLEDYKNNGNVIVHGLDTETLQGGNTQSYRSILQNLGNGVREMFGKEIWAVQLCHQIADLLEITDTVVVSDWRFFKEYETVACYFPGVNIITVKVYKSQEVLTGDESKDISEVDLDSFSKYDLEVDNSGSLKELEAVAEALARSIHGGNDETVI